MEIVSDREYENDEFKDVVLNSLEIKDSEFYKCKFLNIKQKDSKFISCTFEDCEFIDCDLTLLHLIDCRVGKCKFKESKLLGINWSALRKNSPIDIHCIKSDLSYSSFLNMTISESQFEGCKLHECDFNNGIVKKVNFKDCDLTKAIFLNTDLRESDFRTARNYYFDMSKNKVKGCIFSMPEVENLLVAFGIKIENE